MAKQTTVPRWYPKNLTDHQRTSRAIRRAFDFMYSLRDGQNKTKGQLDTFLGGSNLTLDQSLQLSLAALPAYDLFQTGSSGSVGGLQGSIPPDVTGSFTPTFGPTNIQFAWTSLKIYPAHLVKGPQRFIQVPDGVQNSTGLANSTQYFFYPYFDLLAGIVKWAVDPSLLVGVGVALSAPSVLAAQQQAADNCKPLSQGGIAFTTAAGGGGGGGGGNGGSGCLQADMFARHVQNGLTRLRDLKAGDRVIDGKGTVEVLGVEIIRVSPGIELICSNMERLVATPSHRQPVNDLKIPGKLMSELCLSDVLFDPTEAPLRITRMTTIEIPLDYVRLQTASGTLAAGARFAGIQAHNYIAHK